MTFQPLPIPAPLQGLDLNRLIQQWISDVLGDALDKSLVRPYVQAEPPLVPDTGEAWLAFTQSVVGFDKFPYVRVLVDSVELQRHEDMRVLCSFYDTGVNGQAARLSSLLRDGISVPGNMETLAAQNMGLASLEDEVALPTMLKLKWLWRVDLPFVLRRQITRVYQVPNITRAVGTLYTAEATLTIDTGIVRKIRAGQLKFNDPNNAVFVPAIL